MTTWNHSLLSILVAKEDLAEIVIDKNVVLGKKPPVEILRDAKKVA